MDTGSILIIIAVLMAVALFVSRPFWAAPKAVSIGMRSVDAQADHEVSQLLAEKERVMSALVDLDNDFAQGKVPEEEYATQRGLMLAAAEDVLVQLDAAGKRTPAAKVPVKVKSPKEDPIEAEIARRRQGRTQSSNGYCPKCKTPVKKSDRFCPSCGAPVAKA